jgi:hypothetical protein
MLHILARLTYYIEKQSGLNPDFENYVNRENRNSFDIEHIWADHFERHVNEFDTEEDFNNYRNKFGDLLILARDKNRSYNDYTYEEKLPLYYGENLLARSLNKQCYQNNPQFIRFFSEAGLPFKHYDTFNKTAIEDRQLLYQEIATKIWDVNNIRQLAENHVK